MKPTRLLSCALIFWAVTFPVWAQIPGAGFVPLAPYPPRAVALAESASGPEIVVMSQNLTGDPGRVVLSVWNTDTDFRSIASTQVTPPGSRNLPFSLLDVRENIDGSRAFNFWYPALDTGTNIVVGRAFGSRLTNATSDAQVNIQVTTDGFLSLAAFDTLQHDAIGNRVKRLLRVFKADPLISPATFAVTPGAPRAPEILFLRNHLRISTLDGQSWTAQTKRIGPDSTTAYMRFAPQSAYAVAGRNTGWLALVQGERHATGLPGKDERVLLYEFTQTAGCAWGCERYNIGRPAGVNVMSPPLILVREFPGQTRQINVWVSDEATGNLWERWHNGSSWSAWVKHGKPAGATGVRLESGVIWHDEAGRLRINLFGQEDWQASTTCPGVFLGGALVERAWDGAAWRWGNREKPGRVGENITINPNCIQTPSGRSQLDQTRFVVDLDFLLPLRVGSTVAVQYPGGGYRLSVFAVDTRGKVHERVWDTRTGGNWVWF